MQSITRKTIFGVRLAFAALVLYWLLIFLGTHLPTRSIANVPKINDKLIHFTMFAGLGFLLCYITTSRRLLPRFGRIVVVGLIYAAADEWSQGFVRGRTTDVHDFLADACGLIGAVILYAVIRYLYYRFRYGSQTPQPPCFSGNILVEPTES
ncbi:VanZ family protein [Novipirellula aureliae]|nr:VanZ family protein [Novipirellula aureliae]